MVKRVNETPSLGIINALDRLAAQVRKNHPEVPTNIVFVLASGKSKRGQNHGHFAPEAWAAAEEDAKEKGVPAYHEILIAGESLARGAKATLGTLIHELAHATAAATGVRDTSNNGRYHNRRFKEIAEGMGIHLEPMETRGWSQTSVPDETAEKYANGLKVLEDSITTYRKGLPVLSTVPGLPKAPRNKTKAPMVCGCADPVTVSIQWFERNAGTVGCAVCGESFELVEA